MHEMSLTHDVVDTVLRQAEIAGATEVRGVHLTVGEIHDIVDDLFMKCFAYLARGTIAEHAKVGITRVRLTVRCKDCAEVFPIQLYGFHGDVVCPRCGSRRYGINSGEEFTIDDIEVA